MIRKADDRLEFRELTRVHCHGQFKVGARTLGSIIHNLEKMKLEKDRAEAQEKA